MAAAIRQTPQHGQGDRRKQQQQLADQQQGRSGRLEHHLMAGAGGVEGKRHPAMADIPEPQRRRHHQPGQQHQQGFARPPAPAAQRLGQPDHQQRHQHQKALVFAEGEGAEDHPQPQGPAHPHRAAEGMAGQPPGEQRRHQQQGGIGQQQQAAAHQQQRREVGHPGREQRRPRAEQRPAGLRQQPTGQGVAQQRRHPQGHDRAPQEVAQPRPQPRGQRVVEVAQGWVLAVEEVVALVVAGGQDQGRQAAEGQAGQQDRRQLAPVGHHGEQPRHPHAPRPRSGASAAAVSRSRRRPRRSATRSAATKNTGVA